jgi:transposase
LYLYIIKMQAEISPKTSEKPFLVENAVDLLVEFNTLEKAVLELKNRAILIEDKDAKIASKDEKIAEQARLIAQYQRMLFGQKRERFEHPSQLKLPFELTEAEKLEIQAVLTEKIEYTRNKPAKQHPGRLALPVHLPVEETVIEPEGDLTDMVKIGQEVTEELECHPFKLYIHRIIRTKYAPKSKEGSFKIAPMPERVIEKGIPGPGLLAQILIDKYADHLPLYRQRQRFSREGVQISGSTIEGWVKQSLGRLDILYQLLRRQVVSRGYLQVDETTIKVLESEKKGATHQGYYWVYNDPIAGTPMFEYQMGRDAKFPEAMLANFKGYLQTDGYSGYGKLGKNEHITHLACWAHARREFEKALPNDKALAETAMIFIQKLYQIEAEAREKQLDSTARKELRLSKALPIYNAFGLWLTENAQKALPKSQIGKAMQYSINRWDELGNYMLDGCLEIDNNKIENAIRPVALGRKNYLFAGSHDAAQRAAIIYTFLGICKKHEVNPISWLKHTLQNINSTNIQDLEKLLPQNFKKLG